MARVDSDIGRAPSPYSQFLVSLGRVDDSGDTRYALNTPPLSPGANFWVRFTVGVPADTWRRVGHKWTEGEFTRSTSHGETRSIGSTGTYLGWARFSVPSNPTANELDLSVTISGFPPSRNVATTATATITVPIASTRPQVTVNTSAQTVDAGEAVSLDATQTGGTPTSASWSSTDNAGTFADASAVDTTWTAPSPNRRTTYILTRTVSNSGGSSSDSVSITVNPPAPIVTVNTSAQTVDAGEAVSLDATQTGGTPTAASWSSTGSAGTFANAASVDTTWTAPSPDAETTYTLTRTASNQGGSDSDTVRITVRAAAPTLNPPVVSVDTTAQTVNAGASVSLTATFTGGAATSSIWTGDGAFSDASAEDTTWTAPSPNTQTSYTLRLTASNADGSDSDTVRITVRAAPVVKNPPVVTVNTTNRTVEAGASVSLAATITGGTATSIEWTGSGTFDDASAEDTTWTAPSPSTQTRYTLRLTASNADGSDSDTVRIRVNPPPVELNPPVVSVDTGSRTVNAGASVSLAATITGGTATSLAWTGSGTFANAAAEDTTWTAPSPSTQTTYTLRLTASNADGSNSDTVAITVRPVAAPPLVSVDTTAQTVNAGASVSLAATITGGTATSLAWTGSGTFANAAAEDTTWTAPSPSTQTTYTLRLTASNADGSNSDTVAITVRPVAPVVSVDTTAQTVDAGASVSLASTITGGTATSLLWSSTGGVFGNAGIEDTTWTAPTPLVETTYTLTLTAINPGGSSSDTVAITVDVTAAPVVSIDTTNQRVGPGATVSLAATITGGTADVTQWRSQGNAGTFADAEDEDTTWTAPTPIAQTSYRLYLDAANEAGTGSDSVLITVRPIQPRVTVDTADQTVRPGQEVPLEATITGGLPKLIAWSRARGDVLTEWDDFQTEDSIWTARSPSETTEYELSIFVQNDSGFDSDHVTITVLVADDLDARPVYPPAITTVEMTLSLLAPDTISVSGSGSHALAVTWVTPTEGLTPDGFDLRYRTGDADWTVVEDVTSPTAISGLAENTAYDVQIISKRGTSFGSWSATVTGSTLEYPGLQAGPVYPPSLTRARLIEDFIRAASVHPQALSAVTMTEDTPVIPPVENLQAVRQEIDTAYLQARLTWEINVQNPPQPAPNLYALNDAGDEFWIVDPDTPADSTLVGSLATAMTSPAGLAVHNGALYGVDSLTSSLWNIAIVTPTNSSLVGAFPVGFERPVGMVSHDSIFYGVNGADNSLWIIDTVSPPNSFPVGVMPVEMEEPGALASHSGKLYCFSENGLWDIDVLNPESSTLVGVWPTGLTEPSGATSHAGTVYCTDGADGQLWEIDTDTPADSTLVGSLHADLSGPTALASHDPSEAVVIEYRYRVEGSTWVDWIPITGSTTTTTEHVVTFLAAGFAHYGQPIDFQARARLTAPGDASNTASLTFNRPGAGLPVATYQVRMDADGDGTFETELDADWHAPLYLTRGYQYQGQRYGQSVAGNIRFTLRNDHHRYTLGHSSGIFPDTDEAPEGKALRIICQPPGTRARYQLGQGSIEDFEPRLQENGRHFVSVFCMGVLNRIADKQAVTQAYTGIAGEEALVNLLDAAGIPESQRGEFNAPDPINLWWSEGNALSEVREIERTIRGFAYEDQYDRIALQGVTVRSIVSRQEPKAIFDMRDLSDPNRTPGSLHTSGVVDRPSTNRQITNVAQARAHIYETRPSQELWRLSQPIEIRGFDSLNLQIPAPPGGEFDYFLDASAVVTANSLRDGTGADMTSAVTVAQTLTAPHITLHLENTGAEGLFVTSIVVTGTSLVTQEVIDVEDRNAASIAEYGERSYAQVPLFRDTTVTAREWIGSILADLVTPIDRITFSTSANVDFHTILSLQFGDHIHVHDGVSMASYYIDHIEHSVGEGLEHYVNFTCSPIIDFSGIILLDIGPALGIGTLAR